MSLRRWEGQRSDVPIVGGTHLLTAQNVSFFTAGQIQRRQGLTYLANVGALSMVSFGSAPGGTDYLVTVASDGTVTSTEI